MAEYKFTGRKCPCGKGLAASWSSVASYSYRHPMGPCPSCGEANPLNAPKKAKTKETHPVPKGLLTGENEA